MSELSDPVLAPGQELPNRQTVLFVRTWAEEVVRQVERVAQTRQRVRAYYRMEGDEPGIDSEFLEGAFRELWAAEHTLLWAAYQLERWRKRLDRERGNTERKPDKALTQARNVLEHLDEADFAGGRAVAPPWEPPPKPKGWDGKWRPRDPHWSLRKLGGLDIAIIDDGTFCGIASAEMRTRALDIVTSVEDDLAAEVVEHVAELMHGP
jgi:hypothetical protein